MVYFDILAPDDLFWRQPHVFAVGEGLFNNEDGEPDWDKWGIVVSVDKKVDRSTLPEADRIPDCLEGVPVQVAVEERHDWFWETD